MLIIYMFIFMLILLILLIVNFLISKKMFKNREKMSSFECGFDCLSLNRLPFSLQFFMISIIFLMFDVEIALILPLIFFNNNLYYLMVINALLILLFLLLSLYIEWIEGALKWFN
uniref:NADH dehydrogenase subunit 3 n=1 Tax=Leptomastidea bifasciata TaxID=1880993 RepID=UPI002E75AD0A|nr:NADH dehydrogenase subunit 3 [Leptomastidea bifasciata]WPT46966.1 NADH dehydrogenase subunit 3 [Leptomastidea bifasciata]